MTLVTVSGRPHPSPRPRPTPAEPRGSTTEPPDANPDEITSGRIGPQYATGSSANPSLGHRVLGVRGWTARGDLTSRRYGEIGNQTRGTWKLGSRSPRSL